jgi:hypothetical protein
MSYTVAWIAAEADEPKPFPTENKDEHREERTSFQIDEIRVHGEECWEQERERRIYRARAVMMLRRYMRYSLETGRLPSLVGREFFRSKVSKYTMVTFEDRVIFVHDMEKCLDRLDEFSRQVIARHILQEYDQEEAGRLLHCTGRTIRTWTPVALDLLTEILLDVGLMERLGEKSKKSCQGGLEGEKSVSCCEEGKNIF